MPCRLSQRSIMNRTQTRTKWLAGLALASATALVITGCSSTPEPESNEGSNNERPADVDLTLQLGSLLPSTGSLSFLGAPMEAGVQLAVSEINEADAGIQVELTTADEGDLDNKAYETSITTLQS